MHFSAGGGKVGGLKRKRAKKNYTALDGADWPKEEMADRTRQQVKS